MSAEPKPAAELSAINAYGLGVRVRFFWRGDRYGHTIYAIDREKVRPLLRSIEGDEQAEWPTSPPLQHLNMSWIASDSEQGHVAMLVGAAGKSHWSMCIAVRDQSNVPRDEDLVATELFFDVACRVNSMPTWLGSSYRALTAPVAISDELNCACVPTNLPACAILPQRGRLEIDATSAAQPILTCRAPDMEASDLPTTLRWRYAVRIVGDNDFASRQI